MDEEKVSLWKQRMTSFQSSGLSIKKWCRENHIAPPTFYYWRSRLENEIVSNQPTFVEVKQIEKTNAATQAHHVSMSWKELHFEIASKEEADLVAYFIHIQFSKNSAWGFLQTVWNVNCTVPDLLSPVPSCPIGSYGVAKNG